MRELTIINGSRNGAISDIVGVLGCPCPIHPQISISLVSFISESVQDLHQDSVAVRITQQHKSNCISSPPILDNVGPDSQGNDAGQCPDILDHGNKSSLFAPLAQAGEEDESYDVEDVCRDLQEDGVELWSR
jgi:hypothetical protein